MIGRKISNYIIKEFIAEGGMGTVYLCEHKSLKLKAALKVLNSQFSSNKEIIRRFKREAKTLSELSHPNIIKILDFGEIDNRQFLLMEFMDGIPLDDYIKNKVGPINEEDTHYIINQIISAVEMAHANGIIHRDIKPSNVLIDKNKNIKLIDFGIAKEMLSSDINKTKVGRMIGTVPYMSPEQVRGLSNINIETDIYSLGVLLHQMISGKPPYDTKLSEFEIIKKIAEEPLIRVKEIYPNAPEYFQWIIDKATSKNTKDRFQSCSEFRSSLEEKGESLNDFKNDIDNTIPAQTNIDVKEKPIISKNSFNFKFLLIILLIVLVSVIGIVVYKSSNISEPHKTEPPVVRKKESPVISNKHDGNIAEKSDEIETKSNNSSKLSSAKVHTRIPKAKSFEDNFALLANSKYTWEDRSMLKTDFLNKKFTSNDAIVVKKINGIMVEKTTISKFLDDIMLTKKRIKILSNIEDDKQIDTIVVQEI